MSDNTKVTYKDVGLVHDGKQIILPSEPKPMTIREAMEMLEMIEEEQETNISLNHQINCFPLDGAVQFYTAQLQTYGHPIGTKTPPKSMFEGASPPEIISVDVGFGEKMQVPWGSVKLPNISGRFETQIPTNPKSGPGFVITGEIKKKDEKVAADLAELTEKLLKTSSIYKGKAIRVSFEYLREERPFDPKMDSPTFIDTRSIDPSSLIFPEDTQKLIDQGLFLPIEKTQECRNNGIPLKRGILLEGQYGCGKTLTANVTAKKCEENGWTFFYLDDVRDLTLALEFAKLYAPCVIFAEDVDQATQGGRCPELNSILNTLDGVDYKDEEIITILTTNHAENINKAFLRPGRLDTVVPVRPPDQEACERLINQYGRGLLHEDANVPEAAKALKGHIPATIRECVERAKLIALGRCNDISGQVTHQDLMDSLAGMKPHMQLMHDAPADGPSQLEFATAVLGQSIGGAMAENMPVPLQMMFSQLFQQTGAVSGSKLASSGSADPRARDVIEGKAVAGQAKMPQASDGWGGTVSHDNVKAAEVVNDGGTLDDASNAVSPEDTD